MQEIEKLAKDLKDGKLDKEDKEQLAKQLQQMKDKLEAALQAHQQAMDDLKKQIESRRSKATSPKPASCRTSSTSCKSNSSKWTSCNKLAQQMGQMQQGLQQGDGKKAADAMDQMAKQLEQMQQDMDEMEMLDAAMDQIEMAKDAMACEVVQRRRLRELQGQMMAHETTWREHERQAWPRHGPRRGHRSASR